MAETKELILSLKIAGTAQQTAELKKLQTNLVLLRKRNAEINAQIKKGIPLSSGQRKAFRNLSTQIKATSTRLNQLNKEVLINNGVMKKTSGLAGGIARGFRTMALQVVGFTAAIALIKNVFKTISDFDESIANLRKTTGLARDAAVEMAKEIIKIDTKTSVTNLLELATAAGRLGLEGSEIVAFTIQVDRAFVALGDSLDGSAEEIGLTLGKLAANFDLEKKFGIGEAINKVGSSLNELGATSKAQEGAIIEFTKRLSGVATQAQISLPDIQALGALFDETGQSIEVAATTFNKLLPAIGKDVKRFAGIAGINVAEFKRIVEEDAFAALKLVAEGAKSNQKGLIGLTETLQSYGISNARAASIVGILSSKTERLTELQKISNDAFNEGTSLITEFNIKNNTLSASTDKLSKSWDVFIIGLDDGEGAIATAIKGLTDMATSYLQTVVAVDDMLAAQKKFNELGIAGTMKEISGRLKDGEQDTKGLKNAVFFLRKQLIETFGETEGIEKLNEFMNASISGATRLFKAQTRLNKASRKTKEIATELTTEKIQLTTKEKEAIKKAEDEKVKATEKAEQARTKLVDENTKLRIEIERDAIDLVIADQIRLFEETKRLSDAKIEGVLSEMESKAEIRLLEAETINEEKDAQLEVEDARFQTELNSLVLANNATTEQVKAHQKRIELLTKTHEDNKTKIEQGASQKRLKIAQDVGQIISSLINAVANIFEAAKQRELSAAGDNAEERAKIEKKFANKQKAISLIQAGVNTALAVTAGLASPAIPPFPSAIAAAIAGGVEIAIIAATKFLKGGIVSAINFARGGIAKTGGILKGKSHERGGIPFTVGGVPGFEAQGGEPILTAEVGKNPFLRAAASAINVAGGGVAFGRGGQTPIHRFQAGSITPVPAFTGGASITRQAAALSAEQIGEVIAERMNDLRVINVVSDTTEGQLSIENTESEASFG